VDILFFFLYKPSISPQRGAEREARCSRRGEAARPLDEPDPELEFPLPTELMTLIRPLCLRDMRLFLYFSNDLSISTRIVVTIRGGSTGGVGDNGRASMWDVRKTMLSVSRRVTDVGL
jgi:hypothetical protein